jgi:hypothetical protein
MSFWRRLLGRSGNARERETDANVHSSTPEQRNATPPSDTSDASPYRAAAPPSSQKRREGLANAARAKPPAVLGPTFDHHDGGIAGAMPVADVWIHGVPCKANTAVSFHRNGQLSFAVLARAHEFSDELLPATTEVGFETDGRLSTWIATRTEDFATRVLAASKEWLPITIPAGSRITMEHGQLRAVTLAGPLSFDGLAFPAATELVFGDSGALSHVTCPEVSELRGIRWGAYETVVFEFGYLREGYPDSDGIHDGVPYQAGEIVRLYDNGKLARCYLATNVTLSNVPCLEGTRVYLDDRGNLAEGTVARDTTLAGVPVAAESVVALEDGVPVALTPREDVQLDGIVCAKDSLVELTPTGRLARATLARDEVRNGWHLPAGSIVVFDGNALRIAVATDAATPDGRTLRGIWRIELAGDGSQRMLLPITSTRIASLTLREETTLVGLTAAAGSDVDLRADGTVKSLVLATDQRVGGHVARGGTRVHFHDDQSLANLYLVDDALIDDIPCAAARTRGVVMNDVEYTYREEVRLHESGTLLHATLAKDTTFAGVPLAGGHTLARWPNGTLHVGTLAKRWTHSLGCCAREHTLLGLFEDGSPSWITLAEPFTLAGTEYPAGTVLKFSSPGVLDSVENVRVPLGPCDLVD